MTASMAYRVELTVHMGSRCYTLYLVNPGLQREQIRCYDRYA